MLFNEVFCNSFIIEKSFFEEQDRCHPATFSLRTGVHVFTCVFKQFWEHRDPAAQWKMFRFSAVLTDFSMTSVTLQAFVHLSFSVLNQLSVWVSHFRKTDQGDQTSLFQEVNIQVLEDEVEPAVLDRTSWHSVCQCLQVRWSSSGELFSSDLWTLESVRRTRTQCHCCKSLRPLSFHMCWKMFLFNRQQTFSPLLSFLCNPLTSAPIFGYGVVSYNIYIYMHMMIQMFVIIKQWFCIVTVTE